MTVQDISSRAEQLSQQLHALLLDCEAADLTCWLALDGGTRPSGYESTEAEDRVDMAGPNVDALTVPLPDEQIAGRWYPTWLRLDTRQAAGSFLLRDSAALALEELDSHRLDQGFGRRVAGWLAVEGGARPAAHQVAQRMIQRDPSRGRRLLRLHDPAVLWAVWPTLSEGQKAAWLGPVRRWSLLDPGGNLVSLSHPESTSGDSALSHEQWLDIENITATNGAFRRWLPQCASPGVSELERARLGAFRAVRRARQMGFTDAVDLATFATHALLIHPDFDSHGLVRQVLDRRTGGEHYSLLMDTLTQEDWATVRRQLVSGDGSAGEICHPAR